MLIIRVQPVNSHFWGCILSFFYFCYDKKDIYYFRKHFELKPDLPGFVESDLPEDTFQENIGKAKDKKAFPSSSSSKRIHENGSISDAAKALREMNNSRRQSELAIKSLIF